MSLQSFDLQTSDITSTFLMFIPKFMWPPILSLHVHDISGDCQTVLRHAIVINCTFEGVSFFPANSMGSSAFCSSIGKCGKPICHARVVRDF